MSAQLEASKPAPQMVEQSLSSSISQSAVTLHRVAAFCFARYGSLKSPACSCVSITLPAHRKRESQHHVSGCYALRSRLRCDCVWFAVPQPTEWQRIGNQIDAAMIFTRADFVKVILISRSGIPLKG